MLRTIRPAPASRKSETATCAPTSSERSRTAGAPEVPWAPSFRASATSTLLARSAGTSAKSIVVVTVSAMENASTARSMRTSFSSRTRGGAAASRTSSPQAARTTPMAIPASAITRPSVRSCRTSRERDAPIAARRANSRCRAADRASNRLATLAQAMSSTSATRIARAARGRR